MNIPNLPDNLHKVLVLVGLVLLVYSYYEKEKQLNYIDENFKVFNNIEDSLAIAEMRKNYEFKKIKEKSNLFVKKYGIENPLVINDDSTFTLIHYKGDKGLQIELSDSIAGMLESFENSKFKLKLQIKKLDLVLNKLKEDSEKMKNRKLDRGLLILLGFMTLFGGFASWLKQQRIRDSLLKFEILEKGDVYNHCQSCGKNFSPLRHYGKNDDASKNYSFCINCYDNGKFKENLTIEDFQEMKKAALSKSKGWFAKRKISDRFDNLIRWKSDDF